MRDRRLDREAHALRPDRTCCSRTRLHGALSRIRTRTPFLQSSCNSICGIHVRGIDGGDFRRRGNVRVPGITRHRGDGTRGRLSGSDHCTLWRRIPSVAMCVHVTAQRRGVSGGADMQMVDARLPCGWRGISDFLQLVHSQCVGKFHVLHGDAGRTCGGPHPLHGERDDRGEYARQGRKHACVGRSCGQRLYALRMDIHMLQRAFLERNGGGRGVGVIHRLSGHHIFNA